MQVHTNNNLFAHFNGKYPKQMPFMIIATLDIQIVINDLLLRLQLVNMRSPLHEMQFSLESSRKDTCKYNMNHDNVVAKFTPLNCFHMPY